MRDQCEDCELYNVERDEEAMCNVRYKEAMCNVRYKEAMCAM